MKKVLFLIHDLGQGGAEKVLVNLVNKMDMSSFEITVAVLFGGGVNEKHLNPNIRFKRLFPFSFPGNSKLLKLLTPRYLHKLLIKDEYDIEISFLEGPTARIISGCPNPEVRLISWIHSTAQSPSSVSSSFRNNKEAIQCYQRYDDIACVSQGVLDSFKQHVPGLKSCQVLYNTNDTDSIIKMASEPVSIEVDNGMLNICAIGTLKPIKGFDRLLRIIYSLKNAGYCVRLYILGCGSLEQELKQYTKTNQLEDTIIFLGYQSNPYKYLSKCDLFVCSSYSEGFSTAATEALIVGTPVCTVDVSGMRELLGNSGEYGIIVPNDEESLSLGIKQLLDNPELLKHYKNRALERGRTFSTTNTVRSVERLLDG